MKIGAERAERSVESAEHREDGLTRILGLVDAVFI